VVGGWPREILAILFLIEILGELEISLNYVSCPCRSESPRKSGAFSEWSELS